MFLVNVSLVSLFQKKFVNTAESCNDLLKFRSSWFKSVAVLTNIEIDGPKLVHR